MWEYNLQNHSARTLLRNLSMDLMMETKKEIQSIQNITLEYLTQVFLCNIQILTIPLSLNPYYFFNSITPIPFYES